MAPTGVPHVNENRYTILRGKYALGTVFIGVLISLSQKGSQLREASCQQISPQM